MLVLGVLAVVVVVSVQQRRPGILATAEAALKIDRSFVVEMATSRYARTIVKTVISLAHAFGLKVIAEGVDAEEQAALPVPTEEIEAREDALCAPPHIPMRREWQYCHCGHFPARTGRHWALQ